MGPLIRDPPACFLATLCRLRRNVDSQAIQDADQRIEKNRRPVEASDIAADLRGGPSNARDRTADG
jgi:hypothetical protein